MALVLFIGALAIGKLFCSFICPVGSITECVTSCEKEKAVGINGSEALKYLPAIFVVILIGIGTALSSKYEFTTLEKRWGKFEQLEKVSRYEQTGL